ncbi:DUF3828 domain-containing protein [Phenylobacterium sp.]|uniref:DUF3828 domain-containing protein n=1 Tax=Phenylobacterium sp. TaxID=1871053 RepID=UPI002ED77605
MKAWLLILSGLLLASSAVAQDLGQAKAFVTGLYAAYGKDPGPDYIGRQAKQVWSPAMLALMRREAASTPKDEVGALDGDPICNCQDYEITSVDVRVTQTGPTTARADVFFVNLGRRQLVSLDLVLLGRRWRVDDVHSQGTPSLVALLNDAVKARTP